MAKQDQPMTPKESWLDQIEPFIQYLGIKPAGSTFHDGRLELELEPHHLNRFSVAHGGVMMTMLDLIMAQACRIADPTGRRAITVELKTAFVQPGRSRLLCAGTCLHRAGSLAFAEGRVQDGEGALVAFGSGTFKYMKE
jgi:uncharacterized protein (TIGR00369 family)